MASTSPFEISGVDGTYYHAVLNIQWGTPPLGATSLDIAVNGYLVSDYALSDSSNGASININGTVRSNNNVNYSCGSGGGQWNVFSFIQTIPISQTGETSVPVSLGFTGLTGDNHHPDCSGSVVLPASGVPYAHPSIAAGTYDFSNLSNLFSFLASGGNSWTTKQVVVKLYADRTHTSLHSTLATITSGLTQNAGSNYVPLTSQNRIDTLAYWENTLREIGSVGLVVTTTIASGDQVHDEVFITPPAFADLYSLTSFAVARGALSGDGTTTSPQSCSATVTARSDSPFAQNSEWPESLAILKFFRGATEINTPSPSGSGLSRSYAYDDSTALAVGSTQEYSAKFYQYTTLKTTSIFTVPVADSFLTLVKGASVAESKIGVCNGNPLANLDVKGTLRVSDLANSFIFVDHGKYIATVGGNQFSLNNKIWTADGNIVPVMTSNSQSGYIASASSELSGGDAAYKAFNHSAGDQWHSTGTGANGQWLKIQLPSAWTVKSYSLTQYSGLTPWMVTGWQMQGSNNGTDWTTLDTRSSITWADDANGATQYFDCSSNTTAYLYYRILVSTSEGSTYVAIGDWCLYNFVATSPRISVGAFVADLNGYRAASSLSYIAVPSASSYYLFLRYAIATGTCSIVGHSSFTGYTDDATYKYLPVLKVYTNACSITQTVPVVSLPYFQSMHLDTFAASGGPVSLAANTEYELSADSSGANFVPYLNYLVLPNVQARTCRTTAGNFDFWLKLRDTWNGTTLETSAPGSQTAYQYESAHAMCMSTFALTAGTHYRIGTRGYWTAATTYNWEVAGSIRLSAV